MYLVIAFGWASVFFYIFNLPDISFSSRLVEPCVLWLIFLYDWIWSSLLQRWFYILFGSNSYTQTGILFLLIYLILTLFFVLHFQKKNITKRIYIIAFAVDTHKFFKNNENLTLVKLDVTWFVFLLSGI